MFLCQVDRAFVCHGQVERQLLDEEDGQVVVLLDQVFDNSYGDEADERCFERGGGRHVVLAGKAGAVAEVTYRFDHADDLAAPTYAIFVDFDFPA